MTDEIGHDCGIALVRLLKPLEYYQLKYGTWMYGLEKLYLLMEKQRNRGQDGAGVVCVKFDMEPGNEFIFRHRSIKENSIDHVFRKIQDDFDEIKKDRGTSGTHPILPISRATSALARFQTSFQVSRSRRGMA